MADPCGTRQYVIDDDPDREAAAALLTAWHSAVGAEVAQIAHVLECADSDPELTSALLEVAAAKNDPSKIDPRRLAWWCREWRNRVVSGLALSQGRNYGKSARWGVVRAEGGGNSGINGIKDLSPKTEGEGERGHSGDGEGFGRRENNPTNPTNPKTESNGIGQASQTGENIEDPAAGASLFSRPMDTNAAVGHTTGGKDTVPTLRWEPL
jgi:hypothetical protein